MNSPALSGRSILLVEEEPVVALQLEEHFRRAGAKVYAASKLKDAVHLAEHPALSAAVVNLQLGSDSTRRVCGRLADLGVPFMIHTRYDASEASQKWPSAPVLCKPADSRDILRMVVGLL
jgi:DNA-binding response OmpR family regulator